MLPGEPLTDRDYELLERCFISRELADAACLRRVSDPEGRILVGANGRSGDYAGIVIPYFSALTKDAREYQLRRDNPDLKERDGKFVEERKYLFPPGRTNLVYFVRGTNWEWALDPTMPIVIVEGAKKTLAMWEVAWRGLGDAAERPAFLPIGISGVWNWRGRIAKMPGPNGTMRDVKGVIRDLRSVAWTGRVVTLFFDANILTNADVSRARRELAGWLAGQGARVYLATLPPEAGINGPDDAAAKHGAEYIQKLLRKRFFAK
jgi:Domain of unknown function (DUF3854)